MPRQAVIDAKIFEVDLTDALSFGIGAALQAATGNRNLTTAKLDGSTATLTADTFAMVGNAREILMALATLRSKTKVRVLEAPSVLALDGTMAKIVVGGEIPYAGASYIPATGGASTSVQYRETGVTLLVMPRISASGTVTLDIAQEVSTPGPSSTVGDSQQPTFAKTSVSTTLAVKDGETVAIAGLIRDNANVSRSGVPFGANIPLIWALFVRSARNATRTELLIMITPHVIRTPERFSEMTQELKDSLRNVRKFVDEKEREHLKDMEDAAKERLRQQQKVMKQIEQERPKEEPKR